jgi:hypothetical protein
MLKLDSNRLKLLVGGSYDKTKGYFIDPTVIVAQRPTLCNHVRRAYLDPF